MRFDWKDGLLVCGGFLLGIAALFMLRTTFDVDVEGDDGIVELVGLLALGGPVAARRAIFGVPELPEPRSGPLASLLSIVGLLATLFGMLALAAGGLSLTRWLERPPAFELEARGRLEAAHEAVAFKIDGAPVASTDEDRQAFEASVKEIVARDEEEWASRRQHHGRTALTLLGTGLLLVVLGSLATWARYRPSAA